jgi:long-chain-fatty-acyl-CoA reductase
MSRIIELPIIICGEIKKPDEHFIEMKYSEDVTVRITKPSKRDLDKIYHYNQDLSAIHISDTAKYIARFADNFLKNSSQTKLEAIELAPLISGFTKETHARDFDLICHHLCLKSTTYDVVETELGHAFIMDEWVRDKQAKVKAFPRGRAFHILAGNMPITGFFSVFRSVITKNQTVVKLPSRDLITTLFLMKGLIEENSDGESYQNLLNGSLSVFYMEGESEQLKEMIEASDVVCAWGKGSSLKRIKEMVPHSIPYLEFGPKRSYALAYTNKVSNLDASALMMAHNLSIYDQEACLSPQRLFIIGESSVYLKRLAKWLTWQSQYLPRGISSDDRESHLLRHKLEGRYRGAAIFEGEPHWRIIVCSPYDVAEHPLGRTLFVHLIKSEAEIIPFIDDETQCISIDPYSRADVEKLADLFCGRGVSKICETGYSLYPGDGWTHDGMHPLRHFVRLCYIDSSSEEYKYESIADNGMFDELSMLFGVKSQEDIAEIMEYFA